MRLGFFEYPLGICVLCVMTLMRIATRVFLRGSEVVIADRTLEGAEVIYEVR
jgi:hypothetical protein